MNKVLKVFLLIAFHLFHTHSFSATNAPFDHIELKLNFQNEILFVEAKYTHYWIKSDSDSIFFLFNTDYTIQKINCPGYITYSKAKKEGDPFPYLLIQRKDHRTNEKSTRFEFEYQIDLKKQNHFASDWIELSLDKLWYPCFKGLGTKFTSTIHISNLPSSYKIFSYPYVQIIQQKNRTLDIRNQKPEYDVLLMAGKDMKVWTSKKNIQEITFFASQQLADSVLESMHKKVVDIMKVYHSSFAVKAPLKKLSVVLRNTKREEIGYQFYRPGMVVTGSDFNSYGNLAHEIAHHWWLNADVIHEQWLNEGFANYSMLLVLDKHDTTKRNSILSSYRKNGTGKGSVSGSSFFSLNAFDRYYYKSTVVLWNLDRLIGRDKMIELLSERIRTKADTEKSLLKLVEALAGKQSEKEFFRSLNEQ